MRPVTPIEVNRSGYRIFLPVGERWDYGFKLHQCAPVLLFRIALHAP